MKTPIQKPYIDKLSNLNDQLCFYQFNREEFKQKLSNFSKTANPLFTTDLFKNNEYAKKIHVTFEKLPEFQELNETLNFGAYFSFSYEFLSSYIDDVIILIAEINGVTLTVSQQKKEPENRLKEAIVKCSLGTPNQELFDTIAYFRLRRNYFTHILDTLNSKFLNIVNVKGPGLNTYWSSARTELDFTQQNVDEFSENETIDLLKIIKIVLREIDEFIGSILNKEGVADYVTSEIYLHKPTKINGEIIAQRKKKVVAVAKQQFEITLTDAEMDNAVKTIGKK